MNVHEERGDKELKEGGAYSFQVNKIIKIPGSAEEHYVLIGPDEKRYLLKRAFYEHYQIKVGTQIQCSVDKINCTGQVFLEPKHPYYKVGSKYDFLVTRLDAEENIWGGVNHIAWVKDLHRFEWPCQINQADYLQPGMSHLSCRVDRIKKGQLILSLPSILGAQVKLRRNTVYDFTIIEVRTFNQEDYYIIEDPFGSYHSLLKAHFEHFQYQIDQLIQVRVVDLNRDGAYILEPINPYYRVGETYLFRFLRMERTIDDLLDTEKSRGLIWVEDHYKQAIKVKAHDWQLKTQNYQPDTVICKVSKFKKGRLVLENLATEDE